MPENISQAMKAKYPAATHVEWETKGNYYVADCMLDGNELEAWFSRQAVWVLSVMDITWNNLPPAVQTSFLSGRYADWKIEELEYLEYPLLPVQYVIRVEQGENELQLFYSDTGGLLREHPVSGDDDTHWPLIYGG